MARLQWASDSDSLFTHTHLGGVLHLSRLSHAHCWVYSIQCVLPSPLFLPSMPRAHFPPLLNGYSSGFPGEKKPDLCCRGAPDATGIPNPCLLWDGGDSQDHSESPRLGWVGWIGFAPGLLEASCFGRSLTGLIGGSFSSDYLFSGKLFLQRQKSLFWDHQRLNIALLWACFNIPRARHAA